METSLRIITTTIILLWSIQTYKCTEGFKPGKWNFPLSLNSLPYQQLPKKYAQKKIYFFSLHHSESSRVFHPRVSNFAQQINRIVFTWK